MTCSDNSSATTILVVGPPPLAVGGMASVVEQHTSLDLGTAYRTVLVPTTSSPGTGESFPGRVWRHLGALRRLRHVIRETAASVVHIHTCSGFSFFRSAADMLMAQSRGCRAVLHIHGAAFDEFCNQARSWQHRLIAGALSRADRVVVLSDMWRQQLHRVAPSATMRVVENAVSVPMQVTERWHDGPCRFVLLARMDEWKGIDDLLQACVLLSREGLRYELALAGPAGTAGDQGILDRKIAERDLAGMVRYLGPVLGPDKEELLEWADAYVQPSHHEGMPIALLEALARALPCVATRVGAVPEVITDQHEGLLIPPHQPPQLAQAMRKLIVDADRRRALGSAAAALALARFSMDRFRRDLVGLYDELLATPSVRAEGSLARSACVPSATGATALSDIASTLTLPNR